MTIAKLLLIAMRQVADPVLGTDGN